MKKIVKIQDNLQYYGHKKSVAVCCTMICIIIWYCEKWFYHINKINTENNKELTQKEM